MIQAGMYFTLGVLVAGLLAVAITPSIWRRALRLTRAQAEAAVPLSRGEINADRDRLRASFAASNRKLELQSDELRRRVADQVVDINRERDVSAGLRGEKESLEERVAELETSVEDLTGKLGTNEKDLVDARADIEARKRALGKREQEIADIARKLRESRDLSEAQRLEQVALDTDIGNLRDQLGKAERSLEAAAAEGVALKAEIAAQLAKLEEARARTAALEERIAELNTARAWDAATLERTRGDARAARMEADGLRVWQHGLRTSAEAATAARDSIAAELELITRDRDLRAEEAGIRSTDLATVRSDLADLRTREEESRRTAEEAEAALRELKKEYAKSDSDRTEMLTALDEQRSALEASRQEHDKVLERIAMLEIEVETNQAEAKRAQESVTARDAEIGTLKASLVAAEERLGEATKRATEAASARDEMQAELDASKVEVEALNAELFATAGHKGSTNKDPGRDDGMAGDNMAKALAVAEESNTRLVSQLTAIEREVRNLRLENDRLRQMTTKDRGQADVGRKLGRVADAVARLSEVSEEATPGNGGEPEAPGMERAATPRTRRQSGGSGDLADRLRELQRPTVRS